MGTAVETKADVDARLCVLQESVWQLAAIALAFGDPTTIDPFQRVAAEHVLVEAGLMVGPAGCARPSPGLAELIAGGATGVAAEAIAGIRESAAVLSGATAWDRHDDEAITAQGRASAQLAGPFAEFVVPMMEGLDRLLAGPAPVMLDVGVGVAGLATAFCRRFPRLRVVGLDVLPRALQLAVRTVEDAGMGDRIELRCQDVVELQDRDRYCLAWIPAPFLPRAALDAGVSRAAGALVPGGWIVVGHSQLTRGGLRGALARFQTAAFGGTAVDDGEVQGLLHAAGLERVATVPTPEDAPALTVGRRPVEG